MLHLDFLALKLLCCLAGTLVGDMAWASASGACCSQVVFLQKLSGAPVGLLFRWADDVDKHSSQEPKWGSSVLVCACRRKADP